MQISPHTPRPTISLPGPAGDLVVADDVAEQREFLAEALRSQGYLVREAEHGEEALELCRSQPPDAVLLDVIMPGLSGYEVCRRLKVESETAHIPVLLITSLTERGDRLKGIESGASDFISKPVDLQELYLRVRNSVQMKRLYDRLIDDNEKLKCVESLRDNLTHLVVHDMKAPLSGLDRSVADIEACVGRDGRDESRAALDVVKGAVATLNHLSQSLLDFNRFQMHVLVLHRARCDLFELASRAAEDIRPLAEGRPINLHALAGGVPVEGDPDVLCRVLFELIWNAVRHSPAGAGVEIGFQRADRNVTVTVTDRGPSIPAGYQDLVFDILRQARLRGVGQGRSSGPGLAYCRLAIQAHGGAVGLASDSGGTRFWFTIPEGGALTA